MHKVFITHKILGWKMTLTLSLPTHQYWHVSKSDIPSEIQANCIRQSIDAKTSIYIPINGISALFQLISTHHIQNLKKGITNEKYKHITIV